MAEDRERLAAAEAPFYLAKSQICNNPTGGRIGHGVFANNGIAAKQSLTEIPRPLVASLHSERLKDTCANCFAWTAGAGSGSRLYVPADKKVHMCAACKRFRYCSRKCQQEAWKRGHKHECKSLRSVSDKELPTAVLATMDLLIRRKHGLIPDSEWELLCRLDSHIADFRANGKYGGIELMALGTSQFSWTQDTFDKNFVAGMYARVLSNSLTLVTPTFDPLGIMIHPTLGFINHSCEPNAYIVMDEANISIRTLRPIKKNEEIYISYIDPTNPFPRRQNELKSRWFFDCKCSKCEKGPNMQEDRWETEPRKLVQKMKSVADDVMKYEKLDQDPANYIGDTQDEKRVAALQGKAFEMYEGGQQAPTFEQAISIIEDGMRLCCQSGLWSVHRQPYAALRDDLIVNLLDAGKFQLAFMHCAKRYRYILPKLYPEEHHPIRVVQTWQTAMIAQYLSGDDDPATRQFTDLGINLGLIAFVLALEVAHISQFSHGKQSAFSMSANKKMNEMATEIAKTGSNAKEIMAEALPKQKEALDQIADWVRY